MLKIGDFSKLSRISIRMLRHYDEMGLLHPGNTDSDTGYRYYSEEQLARAYRITALKNMGFSLATILEVLDTYSDPKALAEFLQVRQTEAKEEAEVLKQRMRLLETAINRLREDEMAMKYDVILKTIPERYVASVRKIIPAYDQEGMLWHTMMSETAEMSLQHAENCYSLAVFHDEEYKENDVDVEIQIAVKGNYTNTENVVFKTVPEIETASAIYKGSYEQITAVNHAVADWVRDNKYEFSGPMFCIYHVSPAQTSNQDDLVTEVCYPIKRK